jgi:RNA polymerase sigma-70 factor (ECF subfamily)
MDQTQTPEAQLQAWIAAAQEGDETAFENLYGHFFAQVYRYAAFRLPKEVAEDVTAEVFIKAWEKLHTYKARSGVPFAAWLFRIARHGVIDVYRTQHGFDEVSDTLADPDVLNLADSSLRRSETLRTVRTALDKLPKRYQDVLLLSFVSDLPTNEVARVLRMTEGGVRILKMRALRKLEDFLPKDANIS